MDEETIILIVLGIPLGIAILLVLGLCIFHVCLLISGKTTREKLKNK